MDFRLKSLDKMFPHWDRMLVVVSVFFFLFKLVFFAFNISPALPPDELKHIQLSLLHHQTMAFNLPDSPETYHIGPVSRLPSLYGWLMGRIFGLNVFLLSPILFLRLINIILGISTVLFAWKFFRLLSPNKLIHVLGIVVMTNIPMLTFLSASVNYDNLGNLLAVMSFYYFFKYLTGRNPPQDCSDKPTSSNKNNKIEKRERNNFWTTVVCVLLGCLVKHTFLPLAVYFAALLAWDSFKIHRGSRLRDLWPGGWTMKKFLTGILIGALIFLNIRLYGGNLYRFHRLVPSCQKVLTEEQCSQNENFRIYSALWAQAKNVPPDAFLGPGPYFLEWIAQIERGILGVFGHRLLFKNDSQLLGYYTFFLLALFLFVRHYRMKEKNVNYLLAAVIFYAAVLFWFVNYKSYRMTYFVPAGLQGRYIFPVLVPMVFLFCNFLMGFLRERWRIAVLILVGVVFLWGDLPYFVGNAKSYWYLPRAGDFSSWAY